MAGLCIFWRGCCSVSFHAHTLRPRLFPRHAPAGVRIRQHLVENLQRDPRFHDRPIRVHNYALAGYKEPQQVMMLAYLFAMGGPCSSPPRRTATA